MKQGWIALRCGAMVLLLFTGTSQAQNIDDPMLIGPTDEQGLSFGLRGGYAIPLGNAQEAEKLSSDIRGMIPLWLDLGYRFSSNWYLGGFFSYGFGLAPTKTDCSAPVSCSENVLRFGINFHYHFSPLQAWDPWVGVGAAFEILNFDASGGGPSFSSSLTGFEFGNVQIGLDYRLSSHFVVGPFAAFTVGQYSTQKFPTGNVDVGSKTLHEWLMFGLRGVFTLIAE